MVMFFLLFSFAVGLNASFRPPSTRELLIKSLFKDYNNAARPSDEVVHHSLHVRQSIGIRKLIGFTDNVLKLDGWHLWLWHDNRLQWTPEEYGRIDNLVIPSSYVWTPDIVLYNGAIEITNGAVDHRVLIGYDGQLVFFPEKRMSVYCNDQGDVVEYNCTMIFGSWTEERSHINVTQYSNEINLGSFIPNPKINLTRIELGESSVRDACCPESFATVTYTFTFRVPSVHNNQCDNKDEKENVQGTKRK